MASQIRRKPDSKPRPTLRYGDRIGDYVINGFAGTGATSFVYRARHSESFEPVAIKVLHPHLVSDPVKRKRFLREARMMMTMNHPNIVSFQEILEIGEQVAFVMEYIEGHTLEEWIGHFDELEETDLTCLFVDILRGLGHAHRKGIIHRDLKPANMMITNHEGRLVAKIIDFGVARFAHEPLPQEDRTKIVGTAAYISPEEVQDPETVCTASDIYSVGVMMYEAACGRRPYEGMPIRELMDAHVMSTPEAPRAFNPGLTEEFESVIMRAMSKDVDSRYGTAFDVIQALEHSIYAAMMQPAELIDEEQTVQWNRDSESARNPAQVMAFVQRYIMMAMTIFLATGMRGGTHDPHHLNRVEGSQLPFH